MAGVVIGADLWQVGQMRPGDRLRFSHTTEEAAVSALASLHARAAKVQPRPADASDLDLRALGTGLNQMGLSEREGPPPPPSVASPSAATAAAAPPRRSFALSPRAGEGLRRIDLNADAGEGFDDEGLLQYVTSVNVSCGAHAGTPESIARVVAMAAERGAGIGAHTSFVRRRALLSRQDPRTAGGSARCADGLTGSAKWT